MKVLILILLVTSNWVVYSQEACPFYSKYIDQGDKAKDEANFEEAINMYNIALLHCPDSAESAQARILLAFEAVDSLKRAEELARDRAEIASKAAREAQTAAEVFAKEAQNQKEQADIQRNLAQTSRYNTMALNLALQAELEENYPEIISLALRAYYLNKVYNHDVWNSAIVNAFWLSDSVSYGQPLMTAQTAILDLVYVSGSIMAITDGGRLISIDTKGKAKPISNDKHYYLRNSLKYDDKNQVLEFENENREIIRHKNQGTGWLLEPNGIAPSRNLLSIGSDTFIIGRTGVSKQQNDLPVITFQGGQTAVTHTVSNTARYLALGTQNGWLYLYDLDSGEIKYEGPYHEAGSRVSDIAFDHDDRFIGTSGLDGRVTINNIDSLGQKRPAEILRNGWVNCIEFIPDDRFIIGTQDGKVIQYLYNQDELSAGACNNANLPEKVPWTDNGRADSLMLSGCNKINIDEKHSP